MPVHFLKTKWFCYLVELSTLCGFPLKTNQQKNLLIFRSHTSTADFDS